MRNRFFSILMLIAAMSALTISCKKDEEEATKLSVSTTEMYFAKEGGSQKLAFTTNKQWTATSSADWCKASPASGSSDVMSTMLTADVNTGDKRTATITITAGELSKSVTVTQGAAAKDPDDPQGAGTKSNPYLISSVDDMLKIKSQCKEVKSDGAEPTYFKLMADIDLKGVKWEPINNKSPFALKINFNGNGKTISNLNCKNKTYGSLFGVLFGEVYDLKIADAHIEGDTASGIVGGYAGTSDSFEHSANVTNVHVSGSVSATTGSVDGIGGLFGRICNTEINRCSARTNVKSVGGQVGGIVGYTDSGTNIIRDCYSEGKIDCPTNSQRCAGIVGCIRGKGAVVENCISLCSVTTNFAAGGIVGHANENASATKTPGDVIKNCLAWNNKVIALQERTDQYSSGAVVGFTSPKNTLSGCWRKQDFSFSVNPDQTDRSKYPLNFITLCDQPDASESSPLTEGIDYDGSSKYIAPYHGKAAPAGKTASQLAKDLGWSATNWDFSKSTPELVGSSIHWDESGGDDPDDPSEYVIPGDDIPNHNPVTPEGAKGWEKNTVREGITYWSFEGYDDVSSAYQAIHVVEVDLNKGYKLKYVYDSNKDIASHIMSKYDAYVSMNAGFGASQIFIKVDGKVYKNITQDKNAETGVMNWRNDAGICTNPEGRVFIAPATFSQDGDGQSEYGAFITEQRSFYTTTLKDMPNIISGSPLLIDGYKDLGSTYVPAGVNPQTYAKDTEHPWYHQGVRHPRTAIGITGDNRLIMFTVDGRLTNCKGFTAKELTRFLIKYFDPKYAMNLDGGGSTTLCVAGYGDSSTHVVNYPCDNGKKDHAGERTVQTFFYIK